ncbi:prenyltransferase [Sedimentisphaera cyanobacteriorum]|uniref:Prenyltransferase n=1 Tax=Sedimentisphaera cyanobacteriorum TaxID=1940790 RepID=A0A1Q2HQD2_9BACT|nr:UbiA family prenyltransferase [Sedimentisphaera cyanobacteriorum]AQQ09669.1 prenyltransferase [Sedimentisphaera cyanobacteriorum]
MTSRILRLIRLYYSLPLAGGFIVIMLYLRGGSLEGVLEKTLLAFASLFCIISAAYCLNDICDRRIDAVNKPSRVLPSGSLNVKTAIIFCAGLFAAGLAFAFFCGAAFSIAAAGLSGLLILYDTKSKSAGVFKVLLAAGLTTSLYPLAFTLAEPVHTPRLAVLYIHPVWLFFSSLGYELLKDARDVKGDSTFSSADLQYREKKYTRAARFIIPAASLITLIPYFAGMCREVYLASAAGAILLAIASTGRKPSAAIRLVYCEVFLITAGSLADIIIFGP